MSDEAAIAPAVAERRIRLLIVNSTLHIGGAEQMAATLAERLDSSKFEVAACYLKQNGLIGEQMARAGIRLDPIPGIRTGRADYLSSLKLRRLVVERGIDIVHTHDIHGLIDATLCRLTVRRLRHVHTFHYGNYPHRSRRFRTIERALWRLPDALVAVGHTQASTIRELYEIPVDRLRVLWNGVDDPSRAATPPAERANDGAPLIVSVSTMTQQKGLEHLVDAAALLRDGGDAFRLHVAGNGPLLEPLRARVRERRLEEHVSFLGWVPQASSRLLPSADIFVQSSLWEAMSIVVLEAMGAGKALVVTSVGENPHVVSGGTGLVVPPGDPAALAAGLRRVLRDPALRAQLGAAARARYLENFTTRHMTANYQSLYREIAAPAAHAPTRGLS